MAFVSLHICRSHIIHFIDFFRVLYLFAVFICIHVCVCMHYADFEFSFSDSWFYFFTRLLHLPIVFWVVCVIYYGLYEKYVNCIFHVWLVVFFFLSLRNSCVLFGCWVSFSSQRSDRIAIVYAYQFDYLPLICLYRSNCFAVLNEWVYDR